VADTKDLLVEIGTEELPPTALALLSTAFLEAMERLLGSHQLGYSKAAAYATPRRLALRISALTVAQRDQIIERKGPALVAAFDSEGRPSKAAEGFARSCGVTVEELGRIESDKGAWLAFRQTRKGAPASSLLPDIVHQALGELPIPKRMRWGSSDEEFVRPVHWVVMLLGEEVVEGTVMGVRCGRATRGHRFHYPAPIELRSPEDYERSLRSPGKVVADFSKRRELIEAQVRDLATKEGGNAVIDPDLLTEVTALVEWPVALVGSFEERFLDVPREPLVKTMQGHQKYFPIVDEQGRLLPRFVAISNIESRNPEEVRKGNERVIRPRFSDAAFFWEQDLRIPLAERSNSLREVVFQERLGSVQDKVLRVTHLGKLIALKIGANAESTQRAASLCKCDLLTHMVVEFPELQGTMGRHYAMQQGEAPAVSVAIEEHYLPRHAGDEIPPSKIGRALALADRIDTCTGIFGVGLRPTGVKDPFGLRRASLGILRILIEGEIDLDLQELIELASRSFDNGVIAEATPAAVFDYIMERLKAYYSDRNIAADLVDAVACLRPTRPLDFDRRVRALAVFHDLPEAESLTAANKRIRNILRKAEDPLPERVQMDLLSENAEAALATAVQSMKQTVDPLFAAQRYGDALLQLGALRPQVDRFFEEIMVMVDDAEVRRARLALLASLESLFLRVADFSRIQGGSAT